MNPTENTVTRRLAAIVIADVVGYTRLMERDDTGTFARLRSIRDEVVDPAIISHDGRIVKTAGDGLLAEFPSALAALRASVQIQREMAKRNEGVAAEGRIDYRIGVNLGDIMVDGSDIVGDGVNVASRLEALAEPGGICVSGSVREQVRGQLDVAFVDIGEQQVKNIERSIRVFRVDVGIETGGAATRSPNSRQVKRWSWVGAAVVAFVAIGLGIVAVIHQLSKPDVQAAPAFSMAVLPLSASSGSPLDRQIAEGLTQDLTTALGRWRFARVASRGLVEEYRGKAVDARSVGRALNVRHLIEGEVEQGGDKTVVSVRAIDTSTGAQEWGDRMVFDRKLLDAEPMALLMRTYVHVRDGIHDVEMRRAVREPDSASALNLVLRGRAAWNNTPTDRLKGIREARRYYDEAIRVDPNYEPALRGRLHTLHWELYENPDADVIRFKTEMDELSRRAIAADSAEPQAWSYRAETLIWLKRWDEAMAANAHAQALDPAAYWLDFPWLAFAIGRPAEAIALTEREIMIDPPGDIDAAMNLCRGNLMFGRYGEAVPACEKAAALDDATWHNQALLVVAYVQNGDMQKAAVAKFELLKRQPAFSITKDPVAILSEHPEYVKMLESHYYPGLRKAGIPEK